MQARATRPKPVRVGVEATGPLHWFERLPAELGHEFWIGNSATIRASEGREHKTGERDAQLDFASFRPHALPRSIGIAFGPACISPPSEKYISAYRSAVYLLRRNLSLDKPHRQP